jgi:PAS domain S-box-containing protein
MKFMLNFSSVISALINYLSKPAYMSEEPTNDAGDALQKMHPELEKRLEELSAELAKVKTDSLRQMELYKEAESALKISEEKYRRLVEEAGDVVYSSDFNGNFTYVNPACAKLTEYAQNELSGMHFSDLIPPEWKERVAGFYADQFKQKKIETLFSFPLLTKSGKEKWVEQTVVQLKEGDRITGYRAIVRDITERKAAELLLVQKSEELQKNVALLEAANKELESFSYSISHDMRAPIRAILGYTSIIKKTYSAALNEKGNAFLDKTIKAAKRMGLLIDDMLYFIKIGKREVKKSMADMTALAKEAVEEALKLNEGKHVAKIIVNDLPPINCDYYLMRHAFLHLVANAIKYSHMRPDPVIEIGSAPGTGITTYYVKDNGVGFDMKYYDKLFGVFQRLEGMDEFPGTGMGLATVKKIVTHHGGTVSAEGKVNEGATFYISLPAE